MKSKLQSVKAAVVISVGWGVIWAVIWTSVGIVIGIVDPDSIDPGESPVIIGAFLGFMGLLSGIAFWILLARWERDKTIFDISLIKILLWGLLGSTIVQMGFLGHGDAGIVANIKQALLFIAFGGVASILWIALARRWQIWRSFL